MRVNKWLYLITFTGFMLLFFVTNSEVYARGFGGGGGFSRSSQASSGNWQSNRSSMQSSRQSFSSQNQSNRQSWSSQNQSNRQDWSSQNQSNRQSYGEQQQQNRQNYGQQQQQNRQNYASNYDNYHPANGYGANYYHPPSYGYYHPPSYYPPPPNYNAGAFAAGAITGAAIGTAVTASQFSSMSTQSTPVVVNGTTYYKIGSTWYQPVAQGEGVTYVVVQPPQ